MQMLSVRIAKVASPAHVQRAMREMESTAAEVHTLMGKIIATIASIGIRNVEHRLFTWGGAGGP